MTQLSDWAPFAAFAVLALGYAAAFFYVPKPNRGVLGYIGAALFIAGSIWFALHLQTGMSPGH